MQPELYPQDEPKPVCIKYAFCKKKNKRIILTVYKKADSDLVYMIETKRLIGDWKDRNILETCTTYGTETMSVFKDVLTLLFADHEFLKVANKEIGQVRKKMFTINTNIKHR